MPTGIRFDWGLLAGCRLGRSEVATVVYASSSKGFVLRVGGARCRRRLPPVHLMLILLLLGHGLLACQRVNVHEADDPRCVSRQQYM